MKAKVYSHTDHMKALKEESAIIRRETIDFMLNIAAWAIWDKIKGITRDELLDVLDEMQNKALFMVEGSVSLDDVKQMLKDEANITLTIAEREKRK